MFEFCADLDHGPQRLLNFYVDRRTLMVQVLCTGGTLVNLQGAASLIESVPTSPSY